MTESKMIEYTERIKNAPTIIEADGKYITQSAGDEIRQKNYDLIQRQAVMKEIEKDQEKYRFADFSSYARCKDIIKNMPSISQENETIAQYIDKHVKDIPYKGLEPWEGR